MATDKPDLNLSSIKTNLISEVDEGYLPTNLTVLKRLLYETQMNNKKLYDAVKIVIQEVAKVWKGSTITIRRTDHCERKLTTLYHCYADVRKLPDINTKKLPNFLKQMPLVFDISKDTIIDLLNSMDMDGTVTNSFLSKSVHYIKCRLQEVSSGIMSEEEMSSQELLNQSPPKSACTQSGLFDPSSPPKQNEIEEELSQKFSQDIVIDQLDCDVNPNIGDNKEIMTRSKALSLLNENYESQTSSSGESYKSTQNSSEGFTVTGGRNYITKEERGTIKVLTPNVVAAFDKAKVSDRDAVFLTGTIANALNIKLSSLIMNRRSFNTARAEIRKLEYLRMKQLIQGTPVSFMTVHWDGKLISDDIACKKVDRLPILVSSDNFIKIISVPALADQKANTIALAVFGSLKDWGLLDLIKSLCCDTTNVNLGSKGGAAMLLEQFMEQDLLYLACRRHILELLLRAAHEEKFPGTSGPDVPMFKKFREKWPSIDVSTFENGLAGLEAFLINQVPSVIETIKKFLKEQQPRDDYKELLELSLVFLGVQTAVSFKKPGAVHHARWMAKAIYALKIYLFRKSYNLNKKDEVKLYAICKFIIFVYLSSWYTAPLAICAPNNDLNLIKSLVEFRDIDKKISDTTLHKFRNHLWYLSPELSVLSLFDSNVDIPTKQRMVQSFQKKTPVDEDNAVKKFDPSDEGIRALSAKTIDFFTNSQSLNFFKRFNLNTDFLKIDCHSWKKNSAYVECREKLKRLTVVNDCAERAIHLVEEFLKVGSHEEDQKQYLIQFVDESRKNLLSSSDKKKFIKKLKTDDTNE